jgi:hypothetical protein
MGCEDFGLRSFGFAKGAKPQDDNVLGRRLLQSLITSGLSRMKSAVRVTG